VQELDFFEETKKAGFRIILFFIVDRTIASLKAAKQYEHTAGIDLFVPVINQYVGSNWPNESALTLPLLPQNLSFAISERRFSLRAFVLGEMQQLDDQSQPILHSFLFEVFSNLGNLEPLISLKALQ
jgi:hypothetical protein